MSTQSTLRLSTASLALVAFAALEARADTVDARALVDKVTQQYRSVGTESETLEILVVASPEKESFTKEDAEAMARDGGRGIRHKRAVRKALYAQDRHDKVHVRFSLPAEDEGTGYLVWRETGDAEDRQWLYMPALGRVRRVPVSSTATFVGTNLSYEDVRESAGENVERYVYEHAGSESLDGQECEVVIAKPGPKTSSGYASRKLWIDKAREFVLQVEFFGQKGTAVKRLRNTSVYEIKPGVHRTGLMEMRDLSINETTLLWFPERQVEAAIPPEVFTVDYLENP